MKDSLEDLSARARRGELDAAEQRRLQLALKASFEAHLLHRAGCEMDAEGAMLAGDDALSERIQRRVLDRAAPAAPVRRRRFSAWGIAAAVACVAAVATAGGVVGLRRLNLPSVALRTAKGVGAVRPVQPAVAERGLRVAVTAPSASAVIAGAEAPSVAPAQWLRSR
jgi:hypothetical protein